MTTIYLVRHAHAVWTPDEERPLSSQGLVKAITLGELLENSPIDAIYSSPYRRAIQTVEPLARRLKTPVEIVDDLRERKLAERPVDYFEEAVEATWRDPNFCHPGGETNAAAQRRALVVVDKLLAGHDGQGILLSTHGNLLALILQKFFPPIDFHFWAKLTMPDVYELAIAGDGRATMDRIWSP